MDEELGVPTEEHYRKAKEGNWSFEFNLLNKHLDGDDELQVIVRGHLYLEHVLIQFLNQALPLPEAIDLRRVPYSMKIDLCVALRLIRPSLVPPMNKVNELRNRVAHNLHYVFTEKDKLDFYNCYPKFGQTLVSERGQIGKTFPLSEIGYGHMIKVLVVLLDADRLGYIEWKKKRDAAIENARKVLNEVVDRKED